MSDTSSRLVLLVHGAWHGAWCWAALQTELDRRGIPSLAVDLPGHGASTAPLGGLADDADHVLSVLDALGPACRDAGIVLVGHSYGGAVITEVASRTTAPISHLVYLAAFAPDAGECVMDVVFSVPADSPPLAGAMIDNGDGTTSIDPSGAVAAFYADCPPAAAQAAIARLGRQSARSFAEAVTGAPRDRIASTYVRCLRDGSVPLAQQDHMAARCSTVITIDTDHSPFLGRPAEVADVIAPLARTAGAA